MRIDSKQIWLIWLVTLGSLWLVFLRDRPSEADKAKANAIVVTWLRTNGETNIVQDKAGVGIAGNATRMRVSPSDFEETDSGSITADLEFRIRLTNGMEIVESTAGVGKSRDEAEHNAQFRFYSTTFHVIYRSFLNPADPQQSEETVMINGKPRTLVFGDTLKSRQLHSGNTNAMPQIPVLREQLRRLPSALTLPPGPHWLSIFYAQEKGKVVECAVTLDNKDDEALTEKVKKLAWPVQDELFMVEQFMVVK